MQTKFSSMTGDQVVAALEANGREKLPHGLHIAVLETIDRGSSAWTIAVWTDDVYSGVTVSITDFGLVAQAIHEVMATGQFDGHTHYHLQAYANHHGGSPRIPEAVRMGLASWADRNGGKALVAAH